MTDLAATDMSWRTSSDRLPVAVGVGLSILFHLFVLFHLKEDFQTGAMDQGVGGMELSVTLIASMSGAEQDVAPVETETAEPEVEAEIMPEPEVQPEPEPEIVPEPPVEPEPVVEVVPEPVPVPVPEKVIVPEEPVREPLVQEQPATQTPQETQPEPPKAEAVTARSGVAEQGAASDTTDTVTTTGGGPVVAASSNYLGDLRFWLERNKAYPKEARRRRWQGTVYLYFRVTRDGEVIAYNIQTSSGHAVLDQEAIDMLSRAQPLPKFTPDMKGDYLDVTVPVGFSLRGNS